MNQFSRVRVREESRIIPWFTTWSSRGVEMVLPGMGKSLEKADLGKIGSQVSDMFNLRCSLDVQVEVLSRQLNV